MAQVDNYTSLKDNLERGPPVLVPNSLQMEHLSAEVARLAPNGSSGPDSSFQDYSSHHRLSGDPAKLSSSSSPEPANPPPPHLLTPIQEKNPPVEDNSTENETEGGDHGKETENDPNATAPAAHYAWIHPHHPLHHPPQPPVAVSPETPIGFAPMLVDSPHGYTWVAAPPPPPPPHLHHTHPPPTTPAFLHPLNHPHHHHHHHHHYDIVEGVAPPPQPYPPPFINYESGPPPFDPTNFMPPPTAAHRKNKGSRGASLSPKRPNAAANGRSSSANSQQVPLSTAPAGGGGNNGRYTPSPSSASSKGSRGSSPAMTTPPGVPGGVGGQTTQPTVAPGEHVVDLHVNLGETIRLQMGGQVQVIQGPATVRMVSTTDSPPVPLPVQVPPGHVLQQIVDEHGTLRHVILSPAPAPGAPMGVLPLTTPSHPPPPAPHFSQSHNASQPPPHYYPSQGYGPQGGSGGGGSGGGGGGAYHYGNPPGMVHCHPMGPCHTTCHAHGPAPGYSVMSPPTSQGASSPPPVNFHSERARTQYNKLRKKLEQKMMKDANNASMTTTSTTATALNANVLRTPPSSPHKGLDPSHVGRRKDRNFNLEPVGSAGQDKSGDEESSVLISLSPPSVEHVTSTSADVSWVPLNGALEKKISTEVAYELLFADRGSTRHISLRKENETLLDLRPASEYQLTLCALFQDGSVQSSEPVVFRTLPSVPDKPLPKVVSRAKNSLQFRWNQPSDNGAAVLHYILEWDEGLGKQEFKEVYRGKAKQYTITKLQASTSYAVRLAAVNELGTSPWSDVLVTSTSGTAPSPPAPPALKSATVDSLTLSWVKPSDHLCTLQKSDPSTGHGFLNEYHGLDADHTCLKLQRSTPYKFRLQLQNDSGTSKWSEEVTYVTLPDRPHPPSRPCLKGKIHAFSFKVRWTPPTDNGGAPVTRYTLELQGGLDLEFRPVWQGSECEALCDHLLPGTDYMVRVQATNAGGTSDYSEPYTVTTEAVAPGQCPSPSLQGKAKASSLQLRWGPPATDGGAMVISYEVMLTNPDNSSRVAYVGKELECTVASLLPGRPYLFQVRAINRVGVGLWSPALEAVSGAGPPDAPREPNVSLRTPHTALVTWDVPLNNGAVITEYRLEMGTPIAEDLLPEGDEVRFNYQTIYTGASASYEVRGLAPAILYLFRVQALNAAGASPFSPSGRLTTPSSTPGAPTGLRVESATSHSLTLAWNPAVAHGSAISHYNIEWGSEKFIQATPDALPHIVLTDLVPDTVYRVRVQGVNGIGEGAFSSSIKCTTQRSPPSPPRLECLAVGHNYLRLKWADKNVDFTQYTLEIKNAQDSEFFEEYHGSALQYKVTRLEELTSYEFRICASNEVGQGPYSSPVVFKTSRAPPTALKGVKVCSVTERSCKVEWPCCNIPDSEDLIEYLVRIDKSKDPDSSKQSFRTSNTTWTWEGLEPGVEYNVRVSPVRAGDWGELQGAFSPPTLFSTTALVPVKTSHKPSSSPHAEKTRKPLTDNQRALIILLGFCFFALLMAIIVQQVFSR